MKNIKQICFIGVTCWLLSSGVALADHVHRHSGIGFYDGDPYGLHYPYPYYPYYPNYAYPPVVVPQQPPYVYIEQESSQQASQQPAPQQKYYWYHCDNPEGYYPYIKECPSGWQKVLPQPPSQP